MRVTLCWFAFAAVLVGQAVPRFEVATIKPTTDDKLLYRMAPGGLLTANSVVVNLLLSQAFGLPPTQIAGGPDWLDSERWNIQAKAEGVTGRLPLDQERAMLVSLLQDRFQLKFHREMQERPVYALAVAKGGAKFQQSQAEKGNVRVGAANITLEKQPVRQLSQLISDRLGRPVIDKTGLNGEYDLKLEWMPDLSVETLGLPGLRPQPGAPPLPDNGRPNLFTALQEQLGLRLESQRAPVEVIVIDHIERPSAN